MYNMMIPAQQLALSQLMGRGPMINNPGNSGEYIQPRPLPYQTQEQGANFTGGMYGGGPGGIGIPRISVVGGRNTGGFNPPRQQNVQMPGGFYGGSTIPQISVNQPGGRQTGGFNPPRQVGSGQRVQQGGQQGNLRLADLIRQTMGRMY